ncbi:MAG: hypothetical protein JNL32_12865 [Candidatus Kapabacteria bacterium]|nr:hypothetical protein [Candidatus Kapabacteria bacterium]
MNIKQGLKGTFSKNNFHSFLKVLAGGLIYLATPTIANVNGTGGALLGVGTGTLFAVLFNQPMLALGSWLAMAIHSIYIYVNPWLEQSVGRPIFGWSQSVARVGTTTVALPKATTTTPTQVQGLPEYAQIQGLGSLQPGSTQLQLAQGRDIVGYPGGMNDIPVIKTGDTPLTLTLGDIPAVGSGSGDLVIRL